MKTIIIAFTLCTFAGLAVAQDSIVQLNRHIGPIFDYTKIYQEQQAYFAIPNSNGGAFKLIDTYQIIGGDYKDKDCAFTIGINLQRTIMGTPHEAYISPYKADSAYVMEATRDKAVTPGKPFYIDACGHEYRAVWDMDNKTVTITAYNGPHINTGLRLYNDKLPTTPFELEDGKQASFKDYLHKHKYIYVMACTGDENSKKQLDSLKSVTKKYGKKLISFVIPVPEAMEDNIFKASLIKQWVVIKYMSFYFTEMQLQNYPNGVLFDEDDSIVNRGILPSDLGKFLGNLLNKK